MQNPFDALSEHFIATVLVFVAFLAILAFVVTGKKSMSLFAGLFWSLLSLFSSPFIYLKRAVLDLASQPSNSTVDSASIKQYLLTKLLFFTQAFMVILSLVILSVGVVSAWNQLVPSKQLRDIITATDKELKELKTAMQEVEPAIKQMETTWTSQREAKIAAYQKDKGQNVEKLRSDYTTLETRISALGDTAQQALNELKNYHAQNEYLEYPTLFETPLEEMSGSVEKQILSANTKFLLHKLTDIWYALMLSRFEISRLDENQLACVAYPEYYSEKKKCDNLKQIIPVREKDLAQLHSEERYNVEGFVIQLLLTLLLVMLVVWIIGLFIESIWLSIDIASNIRKIADKSEKR
jgi:hypothetical protein